MEKTFQTYEEVVKSLEWLKSVKGQVFYVNWVKLKIRYNRSFIKELDATKGILHYFMTTDCRQNNDSTKGSELPA